MFDFLQALFGGQQSMPQQNLLGAQAPQGSSLYEDGSLRGVLGGLGREGGGLIGQAFGSLFGNEAGNVDLGGIGSFIPGQGFSKNIGSAMPWL